MKTPLKYEMIGEMVVGGYVLIKLCKYASIK